MSTIVGTNVEVTNIKFDSDTTSMIISNAGQVTIQGEGTNTTNLQQGLAKGWSVYNGTGTIAIIDSFNFSSLTDGGSGDYTVTMATSMSSINYVAVGSNIGSTSAYYNSFMASRGFSKTASAYRTRFIHADESANDMNVTQTMVNGDLA
tara:strand:- start:20 stop:466 length:447 start_codon:yes stop_codon:yes gene_type:complete